MSPVPGFLTNTLEKIFFRPAIVSSVTSLSGHFQLVELSGDALKGENWIPGQKIQFHLGNLTTRTYTPISWDSSAGVTQFLFFLHGNGPGSEWASSLKKGDACQFMGPRNSLNFAEPQGPSVFFGDETSIGAAQALQLSGNRNRENQYVFEVSSVVESQEVVERIGLVNAKVIQKTIDHAHLQEVEATLAGVAAKLGLPQWVFTGKAQSIQTLRGLLRARRMLSSRTKVKAYWAEGKAGLD